MRWKDIKDAPAETWLLVRGPSTCSSTRRFYCLAIERPSYRPPFHGKRRWLDDQNTNLDDAGNVPEDYILLSELEHAIEGKWK